MTDESPALVLQSDFGLSDGTVSAMYSVALKVEPSLRIFDLTHEIPQYDIWKASYRLVQTVGYWPSGTVFVSVVDPGVGSTCRSFADVDIGEPLVYINSLYNVAEAINQGSFSRAYNIGTGASWKIALRKAPRIVYE